MATAKEITYYLNEELKIGEIKDSSNNGLQIENEGEIKKIAFCVDACQETMEKTVQAKCQMMIVHHGLIWGGMNYITGNNYHKLKFFIKNNLALYAAHLPLDKHPRYGNNIQIAKLLGLNNLRIFGEHDGELGFIGTTNTTLDKVKELLQKNKMQTLTLPFGSSEIGSIAVVSGGAAKDLIAAVKANADLFLTGEPLHFAHHVAKESKINVIFGGHYETEVWGIRALMPVLREKFKVKVEFIDVPTIV